MSWVILPLLLVVICVIELNNSLEGDIKVGIIHFAIAFGALVFACILLLNHYLYVGYVNQ